jgi:hypothetical protein
VPDEAAIAAARALGGIGLRVDEAFAGRPAKVRTWLVNAASRLDGNRADGRA